ncbi:transglycosylase family protein [Amnibacterium kyonggiense]|uniref:LysM domain-containing protein n=1 Tax=Amnibacterium kyonggiense TaxID=595671 RepID=A0A4R7FM96_9MICO|nr:transglycosylase family protein [Amnibacterium kyonggiense]TDS77567.1 LysM domain-containing protein [Amnibacterium kyonggiense]
MPLLSFRRALVSAVATAALVLGGVVATAAPAEAAATRTWDRLAQCESSGRWHIDTGNGYYGGLQFSMGTWRAHGGSGSPARASKAGQIRVAEKVLRSQGWGAWPACSSRLGLHGKPAAKHTAHHTKHHAKRHVVRHRTHVKASKRTVVVRSGDTLVRIAQRARVRGGWHRLAAANPQLTNPNVLRIGQRLHLPA